MILNIPVNNGGTMNSPVSQGQNEYTNFLKRKYPEHNTEQTVVTASNSLECEATNTTNSNWKKRHIDPEEATNYGYTSQSYKTSEPLENSEITQDVNSGTFNIIANSTFINDLFAYDANLLVPVSVNNLSDSVLTDHQQQQQQHQPIFSVPSTVCVNANTEYIENEEHWQATDLLELDHRYNSTLQTEISQLSPTVNLKTTQEVNSSQQQQQTQFLLPTKPLKQQITTTTTTSTSNSTSLPLNSSTSSAPAAAASFASDNVEQDCDFEDKNLSWLLNFKFDEFPHLNPDVGNLNSSTKNSKIHYHTNYTNMNNTASTYPSGSSTSTVHGTPLAAAKSAQNSGQGSAALMGERSKSPKNSNKTGKKFEELVLEATSELDGNEMTVAENVVISGDSASYRAPKKPPFTYTELIEYALEDKGELTVSGIYQWISDRFPYYKCNDDRWKNSVRHNLSINPHFRKGHKAPQGAGHLWTISSGDSAENVLAWEHKKQRLDLFFKMESINRERLQQHQQKQQKERLLQNGVGKHRHHLDCQPDQCLYDEAAVAAAAIQQEMLQQTQNNNDSSIQNQNSLEAMDTVTEHVLHDLPYNDLLTDEELRKTAGQILNGIHREVEVQSVNPTLINTYQDVLLDNDYLNPIHKDVIVNESGLRHSSHAVLATHCHSNHSASSGPYYVTEIDPLELGIQIAHNQQHHEHQQHPHQHNQSTCDPANSVSEDSDAILFNDEFNLNYFAYNPANDIAA